MLSTPRERRVDPRLGLALLTLLLLALISLATGVYDLSLSSLFDGAALQDNLVLLASRIPRTVAIILVGMSMGVAGMIMQLLSRNRFVSPSTAGTTEAAALGIHHDDRAQQLGVHQDRGPSAFALAGTALLLLILRRIPLRSPLIVPLLGIMLGGVIAAFTTFLAYRFNFLQSLAAWTTGDFSRILRGRYELLWISGALTAVAWFAADRLTVAGMGEAFTRNLGVNYGRIMALGLTVVSLITAVNVVNVGSIPFIGLSCRTWSACWSGQRTARDTYLAIRRRFRIACDILGAAALPVRDPDRHDGGVHRWRAVLSCCRGGPPVSVTPVYGRRGTGSALVRRR